VVKHKEIGRRDIETCVAPVQDLLHEFQVDESFVQVGVKIDF
jgi:hypothetical protein